MPLILPQCPNANSQILPQVLFFAKALLCSAYLKCHCNFAKASKFLPQCPNVNSEILPQLLFFAKALLHGAYLNCCHNFAKAFKILPKHHLKFPNSHLDSSTLSTPSTPSTSNVLYHHNGQQMSSDWLPSLPGSSFYNRLLFVIPN